MTSAKNRTLKVGVFVAVGLALAIVAVFMIGENRRAWDSKVRFRGKFVDVAGLKSGSPVRLGGIDIGSVTAVKHSDDANDPHIYVTISVAKSEAARVKPDTKMKVVGKGLLGDKMVVLEGGSPGLAAANDDAFIDTEAAPKDLMASMDDLSVKANATMESVKRTSEQLADPQLAEDLKGTVKALRTILEGVANNKDGAAHKVIFDPEEEGASTGSSRTSRRRAPTPRARPPTPARSPRAKTGPGLVHTLVYDDQLASGTTGTMVELHNSLKALRTGNGLGHAIVYGDDSSQHVMGNMSAMSDDLREIVANIKAGRGTIGALLVDPTVYEDIKSLVGNVERNQVLRALVRYSIKQSEDKPHATVTDAPQPAPSPSAQK